MALFSQIEAPSGDKVYSDISQDHAKFNFHAMEDGPYKVCFSNKRSKIGRKTVDFLLEREMSEQLQDLPRKDDVTNVEKSILKVTECLTKAEFQHSRYRQLHTQYENS